MLYFKVYNVIAKNKAVWLSYYFERERRNLHLFLKFLFTFFFFVILFLTLHSSAYAVTYYVAGDTGFDTNTGTSSSPWKTIQKAANTMIAGDTVNVKGGVTYTGSSDCFYGYEAIVCVRVSGSVGNYITYQAWPGTGTPYINATGVDIGISSSDDAASYITIKGFHVSNATSWGINVAIDSTNFLILNNIVDYNNCGIYLDELSSNVNIYNNTSIYNQYNIIAGNTGSSSINVKNNIIAYATGIGLLGNSGYTGYVTNYNIFYGNILDIKADKTKGANDITGNPQLVDPKNGNYHLQPSSPARNSGIDLTSSGVTADIMGISRPQGSGYDIGAYEYYDMTLDPVSPQGYVNNGTKPVLSFKKATSISTITSYSVSLDNSKNKNYSTTGISSANDTGKPYSIWKDDNDVKVEYFNENDGNSTNDEIKVYFKGLNTQELTEGKHTWYVTAYDYAGYSITKSVEFSIDKTAPNFPEVTLANVSRISNNGEYALNTANRMPSFSGIVSDPYQGSEKLNTNNSTDTFDKVSSGPDVLNLTISKLNSNTNTNSNSNNTYSSYLTQNYSLKDIQDKPNSDKYLRFYITTPNNLADGYYKVELSAKDKAGNVNTPTTFYLKLNYNGGPYNQINYQSSTQPITPKSTITPIIPTSSSQPKVNSIINETPKPKEDFTVFPTQPVKPSQNILSWIINLIKGWLGR